MKHLFAAGLLCGLIAGSQAQDFPVDQSKPASAEARDAEPAQAETQTANADPVAVAASEPSPGDAAPEAVQKPEPQAALSVAILPTAEAAESGGASAEERHQEPLEILGHQVMPATRAELRWASGQSFDGTVITTPVVVARGRQTGPTMCLTAAVHGDELNGIEIVRRLMNEIDPEELSGTVISVPVVNFLGYSRGSRYLPDRRDLNRFFPGTASGSTASRIAHSFFHEVIVHCQALVDFHTGSFDRKNLPQVRGDLRIPAVLEFSSGFGATAVLHSPGSRGMLRRAASERGIPAITFEVGSPMRLEPAEIDQAVQAMHTLLHRMGMTRSFRMWAEPQALFYSAKWVRSDAGGMLFSEVELGDRVRLGQRLGKVVDPVQNTERAIFSPVQGKVIGMALNQIVLPGFAAYHIGVEADEQQMKQSMIENPEAETTSDDMPDAEDSEASPLEAPREDEDMER